MSAKVVYEDQQNINSYSKLTGRRDILEERRAALVEKLKTLDDAETELTLEGEDVKLKVGGVFWEVEEEEAEAALEKHTEEAKAVLDGLTVEIESVNKQLLMLKVELQQKFGDAIRLEK